MKILWTPEDGAKKIPQLCQQYGTEFVFEHICIIPGITGPIIAVND